MKTWCVEAYEAIGALQKVGSGQGLRGNGVRRAPLQGSRMRICNKGRGGTSSKKLLLMPDGLGRRGAYAA